MPAVTRSPLLVVGAILAVLDAPAFAQAPISPFSLPVVGANPSLTGSAEDWDVGDFNSDGRSDIFSGVSPALGWILALPGGDYGPRRTYSLAPSAIGTSIQAGADLDGDGNEDVLVFHGYAPTGIMFRGDGTGLFPTTRLLPCLQAHLGCDGRIVDIVPGGLKEIVLMSAPPTQPYAMTLTILVYDPVQGNWNVVPAASGIFPGIALRVLGFVDVNGDGLADFVGARHNSFGSTVDFFVMPGIPAPPFFTSPVIIPRPVPTNYSFSTAVATVGDVNGDGRFDLVVRDGPFGTGTDVYVYTAFGDPGSVITGWSGPTQIHFGGASYHFLLVRDFDRDGFGDLVTLFGVGPNYNPPNAFEFHRGLGNGLFLPPMTTVAPPSNHYHVVPADADGDGDLDLVCPSTTTTTVYFNGSTLGFGLAASNGLVPSLATGLAHPGNGAFAVELANGLPLAPCLLAASLAQSPTAGQPIVLDLAPPQLLWPLGSLGPLATDASGRASFPIPLLPHPALHGAVVYAQWAVADPQNPTGYALSPGSRIVFW